MGLPPPKKSPTQVQKSFHKQQGKHSILVTCGGLFWWTQEEMCQLTTLCVLHFLIGKLLIFVLILAPPLSCQEVGHRSGTGSDLQLPAPWQATHWKPGAHAWMMVVHPCGWQSSGLPNPWSPSCLQAAEPVSKHDEKHKGLWIKYSN